MKHTNTLMLMIAKFLYGEYGAEQFSFDFPNALADAYNEFQLENAALCNYLDDEMPEVCAYYDSHQTGDPSTLNEDQFRTQVMNIYKNALPMSMRPAS